MSGHVYWLRKLGYLIDLLICWPIYFLTVPIRIISGEVTILLTRETESIMIRIRLFRWSGRMFRLAFIW